MARDMTVEEILWKIDAASDPVNMTPEQALAFLERLSTDIECRIDGIKDDLRNREQRKDFR